MPKADKLTILSHQFLTEGEKIVDPFIVAAPVPYVVDLGGYTAAEREQHIRSLLASVHYLREIITTLGYTEQEAYEKGFSLNRITWETLYSEVINRQNFELGRIMREKYGEF